MATAVIVVLRTGSTTSSGGAGSVSTVWTFAGAIHATTTVRSTHRCPEFVALVDRSGNEYDLTLGGPARDGTFNATDPALNLFSLSNVDLTSYWFSIDTIGSFQGVGVGATGTVSRSGNVYSVDATLVPWTRIAPKTTGNLHIKGSVAC